MTTAGGARAGYTTARETLGPPAAQLGEAISGKARQIDETYALQQRASTVGASVNGVVQVAGGYVQPPARTARASARARWRTTPSRAASAPSSAWDVAGAFTSAVIDEAKERVAEEKRRQEQARPRPPPAAAAATAAASSAASAGR